MIGDKYNRFTITEILPSKKRGKHYYKRVRVTCDCGNTRDVDFKDLKRNKCKSCGCISKELKTVVKEGDTFGLWTILNEILFDKNKGGRLFNVKCTCGKEKTVSLNTLKSGKSQSCGCKGVVKKEKVKKTLPSDREWRQSINNPDYYYDAEGNLYNFKCCKFANSKANLHEAYFLFYGEYDSSIYTVVKNPAEKRLELKETKSKRYFKLRCVYNGMKARCNNPNTKSYKNYGARGIKIEESFNTFEKFFNWAVSQGYDVDIKLEIDRIDNNGNYSVENCRLVTKAENSRNTRTNKFNWEIVNSIRYGVHKDKSVKELCEIFNVSDYSIRSILKFKTWVKE